MASNLLQETISFLRDMVDNFSGIHQCIDSILQDYDNLETAVHGDNIYVHILTTRIIAKKRLVKKGIKSCMKESERCLTVFMQSERDDYISSRELNRQLHSMSIEVNHVNRLLSMVRSRQSYWRERIRAARPVD